MADVLLPGVRAIRGNRPAHFRPASRSLDIEPDPICILPPVLAQRAVRSPRNADGEAAMTTRWFVSIIRKKVEHLGTVEADDHQKAYATAIEKFAVPSERQNRLFVAKLKND